MNDCISCSTTESTTYLYSLPVSCMILENCNFFRIECWLGHPIASVMMMSWLSYYSVLKVSEYYIFHKNMNTVHTQLTENFVLFPVLEVSKLFVVWWVVCYIL